MEKRLEHLVVSRSVMADRERKGEREREPMMVVVAILGRFPSPHLSHSVRFLRSHLHSNGRMAALRKAMEEEEVEVEAASSGCHLR